MRLFSPRPVLVVEVALHRAACASARVVGPQEQHPVDPGQAARAALATAALAYHRVFDARRSGLEECLVELAQSSAGLSADHEAVRMVHLGPLGVSDFLVLEAWESQPARGRVVVEIVAGRGDRLVPRLAEAPDFAGPSVEVAALAAIQHVAGCYGDGDLRLALALGIEGVIAWYRQADRMSPPHDALTFALAHVGDRFAESGRRPPPGFE